MSLSAISEILHQIQPFQTLIAATTSIIAAAILAPAVGGRIAERYARSRELWIRRLDFTSDLHDLGIVIVKAPPLGDDELFGEPHEDRQNVYEKCVTLYSKGRVIFPDDTSEDLLSLLLILPGLSLSTASKLFTAVARTFEAQNRAASPLVISTRLREVALLYPAVWAELKPLLRRDKNPDTRRIFKQSQESFRAIARGSFRTYRLWAILRPWRWLRWAKFEFSGLAAKKRLLAARTKRNENISAAG